MADHLTRWLTPFGISHMNALSAFFPACLIAIYHILLLKSISLTTLTNYSSGLIRFSCSFNDYHIPEPLHMPALKAPLTMFITFHGMASVLESTMCHWLLGLELWHEINGAPWCGHSTLRWAMKVMGTHPSFHCCSTDSYEGRFTPDPQNCAETMQTSDNPASGASMHLSGF